MLIRVTVHTDIHVSIYSTAGTGVEDDDRTTPDQNVCRHDSSAMRELEGGDGGDKPW